MMTGVHALGSPEHTVVWFMERLAREDVARVPAVAVWRHDPAVSRPEPMRRALGRVFSRRARAAEVADRHRRQRRPQGWEAGADCGGPRETLLSRERRLLRVAGAELPLRDDGRAIVALVDARGGGSPTVRAHVMHLAPPPPVVRPSLRRALAGVLRARLGGAPATSAYELVYPQLFTHPVVAAFLQLRGA
jgi:hypothetical protein